MHSLNRNRSIGRFLQTQSVDGLETAIEAQKAFWKLAGILVLLGLVLVVVILAITIVIAVMNAAALA